MHTRQILSPFLFPMALLVLGCIDGANALLFSGHGGLGWIILPFCFPVILIKLGVRIWQMPPLERKQDLKVASVVALAYLVLAYPVSRLAERQITSSFGLPIETGLMYKLAIFPVGFALPPYHSDSK
jgi:hypothetical protein